MKRKFHFLFFPVDISFILFFLQRIFLSLESFSIAVSLYECWWLVCASFLREVLITRDDLERICFDIHKNEFKFSCLDTFSRKQTTDNFFCQNHLGNLWNSKFDTFSHKSIIFHQTHASTWPKKKNDPLKAEPKQNTPQKTDPNLSVLILIALVVCHFLVFFPHILIHPVRLLFSYLLLRAMTDLIMLF